MLSKREKILIRPWEQRKYENHLRKVHAALPVIDNKPPQSREHVSVKLKKQQKEVERIKKIEHENLILLRKMNYIMKTSRVDNYWSKPLPNFLNRVAIYKNVPNSSLFSLDEEIESIRGDQLRKSKCSACSPKKSVKEEISVPEERVPWDPPKQTVAKHRSKSVPIRTNSLPTIKETTKPRKTETPVVKPKSTDSYKSISLKKENIKKHKSFEDCFLNPQKLILTRGSLKLCVNFPSDTEIKLLEGPNKKLLLNGKTCGCKTMFKAF